MGIHTGVNYVYGFRVSTIEMRGTTSQSEEAVATAYALLAKLGGTDHEDALSFTSLPNGYIWEQHGDHMSGNWASWFVVLREQEIEVYRNDPTQACYNISNLRPSVESIAAFKAWLADVTGLSMVDIEARTGEYLVPWVS